MLPPILRLLEKTTNSYFKSEELLEKAANLQEKSKQLKIETESKFRSFFVGKSKAEWIELVGEIYWLNHKVGKLIDKIHSECFHEKFPCEPMTKELLCGECHEEKRQVLCISWASYEIYKARTICPKCKFNKGQEKAKKRKLEREEEEKQEQAEKPYWEEKQRRREEHLHNLKTMPYKEYLLTDHWNEVRKRELSHAQHKCRLCNTATKLQVHHRTYERRGEEHYSDVIALCKPCHEKFHDINTIDLEWRDEE